MEDETKAGETGEKAVEAEDVPKKAEQVTQTAESLIQNVADQASSYVTQAERGIEQLVSSFNKSEAVQESAEQEHADPGEDSRAMHTQPYVAVSAGDRASWTNCCGLLDFLKPSHQ